MSSLPTLATLSQVIAEGKITQNLEQSDKDQILFYLSVISDRLETSEFKVWFEPRVTTLYHDALRTPVSPDGLTLTLRQPMVALTSVVLGDGTNVTTGVVFSPRGDALPAQRLVRTTRTVPNFYALTANNVPYDAIAVTGTWCYHTNYATAWPVAGALNGAITSTTTTSVTVANDGTFDVGMLIRVDSEYMRVIRVTGHTLTVERGVNGTTAATHVTGLTVYRFTPEPLIQRATARWAALMWTRRAAFEVTSFDGVAQVTYPSDAPQEIESLKRHLRPRGIVGGI